MLTTNLVFLFGIIIVYFVSINKGSARNKWLDNIIDQHYIPT